MDPEVKKKLQVKTAVALRRAAQVCGCAMCTMTEAVFHYSLVPGVFAYGLWYSGEFTLSPVTLFVLS
ncbi:unnamed protein product [Symbiodinium natans]|uniref:Uncharacterized protein n=1 Tax=Symbiodinium natans TaxID=878477 RepID=A0A812QVR6_9DINO|nr:unnamed protein product [Symbiodinium natans]